MAGGIEFKYLLYDFCLLRNDGQLAVLFIIAPQAVVAQYMAVFDRLTKAEFQPFRELTHLVLCYACHHHQPELTVAVQCVDVVILE